MNKTVNQVLQILGYIISFVLTINKKKKAEDKDRKSNENVQRSEDKDQKSDD